MKEKIKFDMNLIEEITNEMYPITEAGHIADEIINEVLLNGQKSKQEVLKILRKYMLDTIKTVDSTRKKTKKELERIAIDKSK